MMHMILLVLAIENLADMLTNLEYLEWARKLMDKIPFFGKIARCKYCQSFWLVGLTLCPAIAIPQWAVMWLGLHRIVTLAAEFFDRYLNRAPITIMNVGDIGKP